MELEFQLMKKLCMTIPVTCHPSGCFPTLTLAGCNALSYCFSCSAQACLGFGIEEKQCSAQAGSFSEHCVVFHTKTAWSKLPIPTPAELSCLWLKHLLGPGTGHPQSYLTSSASPQPLSKSAGAAQGSTCTLEGIHPQECSDPSTANTASAHHRQHAECQASSGTPERCSLGGGGSSWDRANPPCQFCHQQPQAAGSQEGKIQCAEWGNSSAEPGTQCCKAS